MPGAHDVAVAPMIALTQIFEIDKCPIQTSTTMSCLVANLLVAHASSSVSTPVMCAWRAWPERPAEFMTPAHTPRMCAQSGHVSTAAAVVVVATPTSGSSTSSKNLVSGSTALANPIVWSMHPSPNPPPPPDDRKKRQHLSPVGSGNAQGKDQRPKFTAAGELGRHVNVRRAFGGRVGRVAHAVYQTGIALSTQARLLGTWATIEMQCHRTETKVTCICGFVFAKNFVSGAIEIHCVHIRNLTRARAPRVAAAGWDGDLRVGSQLLAYFPASSTSLALTPCALQVS